MSPACSSRGNENENEWLKLNQRLNPFENTKGDLNAPATKLSCHCFDLGFHTFYEKRSCGETFGVCVSHYSGKSVNNSAGPDSFMSTVCSN